MLVVPQSVPRVQANPLTQHIICFYGSEPARVPRHNLTDRVIYAQRSTIFFFFNFSFRFVGVAMEHALELSVN